MVTQETNVMATSLAYVVVPCAAASSILGWVCALAFKLRVSCVVL